MKLRLIFLIILSITVTALSAYAEEQAPVRAVAGEDGIQRAEVVGGGYFFRPNRIIVRVNVPVELKVRKESGYVPHDIIIKAPEAGIDVSESLAAEPKLIRFTPTKIGTYPFYCGKKLLFFESHREKGMEGVLEVVE